VTFENNKGIYLIAEIGGNHEGDFDYAKYLTRLAAESGVNAIKYQIYTGDMLVNPKYDPDRNKHFKKFELTKDQYIELANLCQRLGVTFMASVWDVDAIDWVDPYSTIYKIGSGDMTAYNLIKKIVLTKKPIVLSTGLATMDEVRNVVAFIKELDKTYIEHKKLSILQCTSMYPIPDEDANLNVIRTYIDEFNLPIGYSDHTVGTNAIDVAVSMGAKIIEVHFTDTREGKVFRDHKVSLTKEEILSFLSRVKKIKTLQGIGIKSPTPSEIASGHVESFRRAVYAKHDLPVGHKLEEKDLLVLRPIVGTPSEKIYDLIGVELKVQLSKYDTINVIT